MSYPIHPLALMVPEMDADQFADLRADIAARGLHEPIVLHEGMVLDGRHRMRACDETGTSPRFVTFEGDSPAEFVLSMNVKRRHLTASQRAVIAVEFLPALEDEARERQREHGGTAPGRPAEHSGSVEPECSSGHRAREAAGALVGVSGATVDRAKRVKREEPEMYEQVKAGAITVRAADTAIRERDGNGAVVAPADPGQMTERQEARAHAHRRKVIDIVSTLSGFARGIDSVDVNRARAVMDEAELREWDRSLSDSLSKLRGFRSNLQKGRP